MGVVRLIRSSSLCNSRYLRNLQMLGKIIQTVNQTTIKLLIIKPDVPKSTYICEHGNSTRQSVDIKVDLALELNVKFENKSIDAYDTVPYGGSIDIFCSGAGTVQLIRPDKNNTKIYAEKVNKTNIKTSMANLTVGEMKIACVDREDVHFESPESLTLNVVPRMEVTSLHSVSDDIIYVQFGNSLEIICSAPDAKKIILHKLDLIHVIINDTETINETTIKWYVNNPSITRLRTDAYSCSVGGLRAFLLVVVDVLPEPEGFHCVAHYEQYLNCSWTVLSDRSNFTFSEIGTRAIPICTQILKYSRSKFCNWNTDQYPYYPAYQKLLSFLIQSCNLIGCTHHTYSIDHVSILKRPPPEGLRVLKSSSRSALLAWNESRIHVPERLSSYRGDFLYKVEYWHSGIQPLQVNSSLVSCREQSTCNFFLKLPCPGVTYQVWVYQKLKKSVGEEYWSEPSVIHFYIEDEYSRSDVEDPTCSQDPLMEKEALKYRVRVLRNVVRTEMRQKLRKKVNALKEKVKLIRSYQGEL